MMTRPAAFWIIAGSAFVFLLVWEQLQSVRLGYRLEKLHAEAQAGRDRNAYLRLELERLRAPEWLAQAAQKRLKMAPPRPESVILVGTPAPAALPRTWLLSRLFAGPKDYR